MVLALVGRGVVPDSGLSAEPGHQPDQSLVRNEPRCAGEYGQFEFDWDFSETPGRARTPQAAVEKLLAFEYPGLVTAQVMDALVVRYDIEEESDDRLGSARVEYAVGSKTLLAFDVARRNDRYIVSTFAGCSDLLDSGVRRPWYGPG